MRVSYPTEDGGVMFFCPGCKCGHRVWVRDPAPKQPRWTFNGDFDKPTFSPSILITSMEWQPPVTPENIDQWKKQHWEQKQVEKRCHSHVTDGVIIFCGDCTHSMSGKSVKLEPF